MKPTLRSQNVDEVDKLIEWLKFIHQQVNDQLKFGESKNGAVLILNSAIVIGYLTLLPFSLSDCPPTILIYSISFLFFNTAAILISLCSLLPDLDNEIKQTSKNTNDVNLLFFIDLSFLSEEELILRMINELQLQTNCENSPFAKQLANQIIKLSIIGKNKHRHFVFAIWLTIFGITTPVIGTIVFFAYKRIARRNN